MEVDKIKQYTADFETTTDERDCRVWAFSITEIGNEENTIIGKDINEFFTKLETLGNCSIYFHNLKFDGQFLIYYMLTNNYTYIDNDKLHDKSFNCLISDTGVFYTIKIRIKKHCIIKVFDSYKKLPFPVSKLPKAFNLDERKGEIDYTKTREIGYELDDNEKEYVKNDTIIVAKALNIQFSQGLTKMTISSDALNYFKTTINFDENFPVLPIEIDDFIRKAYRGGWVYLKPEYSDIDLGKMETYDINSLYPWTMRYCLLPYDTPVYFNGEYTPNDEYPLYIQHMLIAFKLKPNHLPTIQDKKSFMFISTEYITECLDEPLEVYLTSVDFDLFKDMYDIEFYQPIDGYMFKGKYGIFDNYIDFWNKIKMENSAGHGDESLRTIAKLMMNSLYGRFATQCRMRHKIPYIKDNGILGYHTSEEEIEKPIYTALACFVTAYARNKTIRSAMKVYDNFVYADTDSLSLIYDENNKNKIEVDPVELGKFKLESIPTRARFLRAKTYIKEIDGKLEVKCAGMNPEIKAKVTWENFHYGFEMNGKHRPKNVKGGVIIETNTPFTITPPKIKKLKKI